jgi:transcriptional regulator
MSGTFDRWTGEDLADLIAASPLAWVMALADPASATPMPILLERDEGGRPVSLLGHLPRAHPVAAALAADGRALFLFQGPQGYISPEWLTDKDWAPTWNFAVARIEAEVTLDDGLTDEALRRLVAHMEQGRREPWTVEAMGPRYDRLCRHVIGFRAAITRVGARFKLGQDEGPEVFGEILDGLGAGPLADWMRRFAGGD